MKIKAGILQFRPILGDPDANIKMIDSLLENCEDLDIIVLPELSNSGYNFQSKQQAFDLSERIEDSKFVSFLTEKAKQLDTLIIAGLNESDGGKIFNTAVVINPDGVIGKYRKSHLYVNEKDFFEPGDLGFPVFEYKGFKVGISICFDYLFPEIWRMQAEQGADIICHPSNLISGNAYKVIPALALINKIYVLTANRYGTEGELTFCGKSFITNPDGDIIEMAATDKNEVISADLNLDMARNKMVTIRNHAFDDRRPDIYS